MNTRAYIGLTVTVLLFGLAMFWFGRATTPTPTVVGEVQEEQEMSADTLNEWTTLQMAIVMTESQFNPKAVGKDGDWGVFQITDIYSKELNRIQKKVQYSHEDAFDIEKAVAMFGTMQEYYNPEKSIDRAFEYHNRARWYRKRVMQNIIFIQRMEKVRKVIKENEKRTYL